MAINSWLYCFDRVRILSSVYQKIPFHVYMIPRVSKIPHFEKILTISAEFPSPKLPHIKEGADHLGGNFYILPKSPQENINNHTQ